MASKQGPAQPQHPIRRGLAFIAWLALLLIVAYAVGGFLLLPGLAEKKLEQFAAQYLDRELRVHDIDFNPLSFSVEIEGVQLRERDGSLLASLQQLSLKMLPQRLLRREIVFSGIALKGPWLHLELYGNGENNLARLAADLQRLSGEGTGPKHDPQSDLAVTLQRITIQNGTFRFTDRSDSTHAEIELLPIHLELNDLVLGGNLMGEFELSASVAGGGSLAWRGNLGLDPIRSTGNIVIRDHLPVNTWEFLQDELNIERPGGTFDASAEYRLDLADDRMNLVVERIELLLKGFSLTRIGAAKPVLDLEKVALSAGRYELHGNRISIGDLSFAGGTLRVVRNHTLFNWNQLVNRAVANAQSEPTNVETTPWQVELHALRVEDMALEVEDLDLVQPVVAGTERMELKLSASAGTHTGSLQATVNGGRAEFHRIFLQQAGAADRLLSIERGVIDDAVVDLASQRVQLGRVQLQGGQTQVEMEKSGRLNWLSLWDRRAGLASAPASAPPAETGSPWLTRIDSVGLGAFDVLLVDHTRPEPVRLRMAPLGLELRDIRSDRSAPIGFELTAEVAQGGRVQGKGRLDPSAFGVEADVEVSGFSLPPFQPYLQSLAKVTLETGDVSIAGSVRRDNAEAGTLAYTGQFGSSNLLLLESESGDSLAGWARLEIPQLTLTVGPDKLTIDELRLHRPLGKFIIDAQLENNWQGLAVAPPEADQVTREPAPAAAFPVRIGTLDIEDGVLDFADLSLPFEFRTRIHELKGRVAGISNEQGASTASEFEGRVDEFGSVKIAGEISPTDPTGFLDMSMAFQNLEMPGLTPYTAKFAGRKIDEGKLSLDLHYKLSQRQLQGENQITVERIKLGEKVASPDAIDAPLELAIALLQDPEGKIDLGLPVSGDLDNPQFSYGHLVWKALGNLLANIVTAPFRALGAALGVNGENLDAIAFEPGRAKLSPPEEEKLAAVVKILKKRPKLRLGIEGRYDPELDARAMQEAGLRLALFKRMGVKIKPGQKPPPVSLSNAKTRAALEGLYAARGMTEKLAKLKAEFGSKKGAGGPAKPGQAEGQKGGEEALYRQLYADLLAMEPVSGAELPKLAERRSGAILAYFEKQGKLPKARVELLKPAKSELSAGKGKHVVSALSLTAGG